MSKFVRIILLLALISAFFVPTDQTLAESGVQPLVLESTLSPFENINAPQDIKAAAWYDGRIIYSTITNCISIIQGFPYTEYGMGTYVGFAADPNTAQPGPGQVYYAHVVIAGLGNACSGQRAYLDIQLPTNTSLAISGANPVKCFAGGSPINPPSDCPQTLPSSSLNPGAYSIYSTDAAHNYTWPMPQGAIWEFHIPLVSSTLLTNSTLQANVLALDGNSSPWLRPQVGVYVFSNSPSIIYPGPSTVINPGPPATYRSSGYLYTFGLGGTFYFELGTTASSYGLFSDSNTIPSGGTAWELWTDWTPYSLLPNFTYHWRIRFVGSNSQTYYGVDQTFTTPPDGQAVVGTGTAGSCTGAAFTAAMATPGLKEVSFNCGNLPTTITLTSGVAVSSNVTIDGKNLITLNGNSSVRHFDILTGATLTLQKITLSGGNVTGCGGALHVQNGATLNTTNITLKNNNANGNGGAVCVESGGSASFNYSLVTSNTASGSGGGVYNQGIAELRFSDLSSNSAQVSGGGVWNSYIMDVNFSLIANNSLPANGTSAGGGIYTNYGLSLFTSTVSGNVAANGGGIFSQITTPDNTQTYLTGVTLAGNTATNAGSAGGLESIGSRYSILRNTLIANNTPGNCGTNPARLITSLGNNLDSGNQCNFNAIGDKVNSNPRLGSLSLNGGPTRTMPLMGGSPAIDTADSVYCGMWDQRGFSGSVNDILSRDVDGNGDGVLTCDIGAFEYYPQVFLPIVRR
jgi:hypothetical protein